MIKPTELPNYRPKGNVLIEFAKDTSRARKGTQKWATLESANILKEKGVAKILKEYSKEEIDELVAQGKAKANQIIVDSKKK